jgi:hypothetical protein
MSVSNGATTLSITTLSITTLNIRGLFVTLSINDNQHNNALQSGAPKCRVLFSIMPSDITLNVVKLNVVMLSVVAPRQSSLNLHMAKNNTEVC